MTSSQPAVALRIPDRRFEFCTATWLDGNSVVTRSGQSVAHAWFETNEIIQPSYGTLRSLNAIRLFRIRVLLLARQRLSGISCLQRKLIDESPTTALIWLVKVRYPNVEVSCSLRCVVLAICEGRWFRCANEAMQNEQCCFAATANPAKNLIGADPDQLVFACGGWTHRGSDQHTITQEVSHCTWRGVKHSQRGEGFYNARPTHLTRRKEWIRLSSPFPKLGPSRSSGSRDPLPRSCAPRPSAPKSSWSSMFPSRLQK